MEYLTLVNRTKDVLYGTWDGKEHKIVPGKNAFPAIMAQKFKDQHPIMGTENPYTLEKEYLCGIEEFGDDCSPTEQSNAVELWDRKKVGGRQVEVVPGNGGIYRHEAHSPLGTADGVVSGNFEKAE